MRFPIFSDISRKGTKFEATSDGVTQKKGRCFEQDSKTTSLSVSLISFSPFQYSLCRPWKVHKLPKTLKSGFDSFQQQFQEVGTLCQVCEQKKNICEKLQKSSFIFSPKIHRRRKVCQNSFVHQKKKLLSRAEFR